MVIASHVIFTAYGFWLPNDPRGSWSQFVGSWELYQFGPATKTDVRHSVAHVAHDNPLRQQAKHSLQRKVVDFSGIQALEIARAFAEVAKKKNYIFYACSILPRHIHAVIGRHERAVEDIVAHLKYAASRRLVHQRLHPFQDDLNWKSQVPTMWTKRCWKVFLETPEDVRRAVKYVENNPIKDRKRRQGWSFVETFE